MILVNCGVCGKKLRKHNTIGTCRIHRTSSDTRKEYMRSYYSKHQDEIREYKKLNRKKNRDRINSNYLNRLKTDLKFRLAHSLRNRIKNALKRGTKSGSAVRDLGCSLEEFKIHLEKQFKPGMTWQNYGKEWHIDHIFPLSKANLENPEEFKKVAHFSNLQPLWAEENIRKFNRI